MAINPYAQYQQQSMMTMTQGELLIQVYDGLIKFLYGAIDSIEKKDIPNTNINLQKAENILIYLRNGLNMQYEVSNNLYSLYTYFFEQCMQGNLKKDKAILEPILEMVQDLRDTYVVADKKARQEGVR